MISQFINLFIFWIIKGKLFSTGLWFCCACMVFVVYWRFPLLNANIIRPPNTFIKDLIASIELNLKKKDYYHCLRKRKVFYKKKWNLQFAEPVPKKICCLSFKTGRQKIWFALERIMKNKTFRKHGSLKAFEILKNCIWIEIKYCFDNFYKKTFNFFCIDWFSEINKKFEIFYEKKNRLK